MVPMKINTLYKKLYKNLHTFTNLAKPLYTVAKGKATHT